MTLDHALRLVRLWWTSPDLQAFCDQSGMDRREASNWACNMRRHNVELRAMPADNRNKSDERLLANDYTQLRLLADSLRADVERQAAREVDAERANKMRRRVSYESAYKGTA